MPSYQIYQLLNQITFALFVFAFGACVGSLINVIAYRLPRGLNIVTPSSRCPSCETKLTWRENIPIFGWIFLKGRCRFCKSKISPEYPIVEAIVAFLFLVLYATWYLIPHNAQWMGMDIGQFRPQWTLIDLREMWPRHTWPTFLVVLALVGSLVAMTLVDAKTFTIPLELPWFATIFALIAHTAHAAFAEYRGIKMPPLTSGQVWFIPTPDSWAGVLAVFGAMLGLAGGILMLRLGLIRRSFADYDEWEKKAIAEAEAAQPPAAPGGPPNADALSGGPEMWLLYPHARREVIKELLFLTPCALFGYIGWIAGKQLLDTPALWIQVLAGVLLGYLVGGAVVWAVRIFGSLAFGKEAMGMGDVHLMAAVGASIGWIDSTVAFFGAAFVGLAWNLLGAVFSGKITRQMPYGPYLAASTLLVILLKPLICRGLAMLNIPIC
jgi:leader peptidase (prepilin peptidase)/N-methyltransferase